MTDKNRGFFGVEREAWQKAITLGLNPAVAYLVLARFTAADQHLKAARTCCHRRPDRGRLGARDCAQRPETL
jgi:hypothetical protein